MEAAVLAILVLTVHTGNKMLLGRKHWKTYYLLGPGAAGCRMETEQWFEGSMVRPALTEPCPVGMESQASWDVFCFGPTADTLLLVCSLGNGGESPVRSLPRFMDVVLEEGNVMGAFGE